MIQNACHMPSTYAKSFRLHTHMTTITLAWSHPYADTFVSMQLQLLCCSQKICVLFCICCCFCPFHFIFLLFCKFFFFYSFFFVNFTLYLWGLPFAFAFCLIWFLLARSFLFSVQSLIFLYFWPICGAQCKQTSTKNTHTHALVRIHTCVCACVSVCVCVCATWLAAFQYGANWVFNCLTLHFLALLFQCVIRFVSATLHYVVVVPILTMIIWWFL